jgi:ATP-dependent Lhr-like helicase
MEVSGPVSVGQLENILGLPRSEIDTALLGLESEGFVLRGKFHPDATEQEWCDRRLLARIHRLTIDRLRAEIQPVSIQDFYRFLFAWQRVDADRRVEGPEGLQSVLTAANCHWRLGNRPYSRRVLPITILSGSIVFVFLVGSAGDV